MLFQRPRMNKSCGTLCTANFPSILEAYLLFQLHDVNNFDVAMDKIAFHVDVSEESEYDLWSDRFGSWIGRSSKSRSPDSFKSSRYDRKSSSGYSSIGCATICCYHCLTCVYFVVFIFARFLHLKIISLSTP